jgi:hypothetical protein
VDDHRARERHVGRIRPRADPRTGPVAIDVALALKLVLTPALIATASLAGRRWGHAISGWLVGVPFTSGPITLFLFLDHGATFAANAALGSMLGIFATIAWALAYCALASRGLVASVAAGFTVFALVGAGVRDLAIGPIALSLALVVLLVIAIRLVPGSRDRHAVELPRWDLPARMVLATALVITITSGADALGPRLSGLLATIPLYASILAGFGHTLAGPRAAIDVWRGLLFGLFGFGAFYVMLAVFLEPAGIAAFGFALAAAVVMQAVTLRVLQRSAASSRTDGTRSDVST